MSTRCLIGIKENDNRIKSIYCHWDGNPESVGSILESYYTDKDTIEELMNLGDLSFLGEIPEDDPELWDDHNHSNKCCTYKGRGEDNVDYQLSNSIGEYLTHGKQCWAEYCYLFANNKWTIVDTNENGYLDLFEYLLKRDLVDLKPIKNIFEDESIVKSENKTITPKCEEINITNDAITETLNVNSIRKIQVDALYNKICSLPLGKTMLDNINNSIYLAAEEGKNVSSALIFELPEETRKLLDSYYKALGFVDTDYGVFLNRYRVHWN